MVEVTVYSKPGCQQCVQTAKKLDAMKIPYYYVDVTQDDTARTVVEHLGYRQLPVVLVGDMHWSGLRPDRLNNLGRILNSQHWKENNFHTELAAIEYLRKEMGWKT